MVFSQSVVQYLFYNHETLSKFLGQNSVVKVFSKDLAKSSTPSLLRDFHLNEHAHWVDLVQNLHSLAMY